MQKVIIYIQDDNTMSVVYETNNMIYPLCDVNQDKFAISELTDPSVITIIADLIYKVGKSFINQLREQGFINNPLNKPTDSK